MFSLVKRKLKDTFFLKKKDFLDKNIERVFVIISDQKFFTFWY